MLWRRWFMWMMKNIKVVYVLKKSVSYVEHFNEKKTVCWKKIIKSDKKRYMIYRVILWGKSHTVACRKSSWKTVIVQYVENVHEKSIVCRKKTSKVMKKGIWSIEQFYGEKVIPWHVENLSWKSHSIVCQKILWKKR